MRNGHRVPCFAQCAIIAAPTSVRHGSVMVVDWSRRFENPIPLLHGRQLITLKDAAEGRDFMMHSRIGVAARFESQRRTNVY
jgi:hypothetical protein